MSHCLDHITGPALTQRVRKAMNHLGQLLAQDLGCLLGAAPARLAQTQAERAS